MYNEATACNVTADIIDVSALIRDVIQCCHEQAQKNGKKWQCIFSDCNAALFLKVSVQSPVVNKKIYHIVTIFFSSDLDFSNGT